MHRTTTERLVCSPGNMVTRRELLIAALVLLLVALLTRAATFGHPDLYVDEAFYFAAGVETQHGAIPYVDVWDRKPPGHFLLFAFIAGISEWYVTYQLAAMLFAAATAWTIYAAARRFATASGAIMGATTYLLAICLFNGHGGQSPVFYNLFVAIAGALTISAVDAKRAAASARPLALAMLMAGIAITIKTTAVFEAIYFGLFAVVAQVRRHGIGQLTAVRIAAWMALGALPTILFALWYAAHGYWDEYWTAMVLSNLRKPLEDNGGLGRLAVLAAILLPFAAAAILSMARMSEVLRTFFAGWLIAATIGFFSVPAFYLHYALPLLVPLCLAAAGFFERKPWGLGLFGLVAIMILNFFPFFDFAATRHARAAMDRLVEAVRASKDDGSLLVFDGPPLLYTLTDSRFPTPLAFPNHLHQESERNVSHIDTATEVRRILAARPGAIVDRTTKLSNPVTTQLVRDYEKRHCTEVASAFIKRRDIEVKVYGHCRQKTP